VTGYQTESGQDGAILPAQSNHKRAKKKKELGQYSAILTEQAWSITHISQTH